MIFISVAHSVGSGAVNHTYNLQEYNCSQVMSKACADHLKTKGVEVVLYDIGKIDKQSERIRLKKAEILKHNPQLALEIHLNSVEPAVKQTMVKTDAHGKLYTQMIYGNDSPVNYSACFHLDDNESTERLSSLIINNFKIGMKNKIPGGFKYFSIPSPGFNTKRFWYLTDNKKTDTVLVEPCFISNNEQAKFLMQEDYLNSIGYMVAEAIVEWMKK